MNSQLNEKRNRLGCEIEILEVDLEKLAIEQTFDGIISSMTMHHVEDVKSMFGKFHSMLNDGGFVAIADLDTEDGSFHTEDTGVFHFGFDRDAIAKAALEAGFRNVDIVSASVVHKPQGDYPVFLLTGFR
jgi:2-polyprenyl-3-methyl-5-hydroxy-6-metoxy-1,4-benzoquinol methylase